jgi:uncharacterized protein (TIGR02246 family)
MPETTFRDPGPRDVLGRLTDAWNAADAPALAQLFTADATFVTWRGDVLTGRSEIQQAHQDLFARSRGRTHVRVIDARLLGDRAAVVLAAGGTGEEGEVGDDKLQTFVMVRRDERWLVAAFHNTAMSERSRRRYQGAAAG